MINAVQAESPRAKLARLGPEGLSDKELLAVVLRDKSGTAQAEKVMAAGGISVLRDSKLPEVVAALELGRRAAGAIDSRPVLDSAQRVVQHIPAAVRDGMKEHFCAFYLNARSQLLHFETVSIGTLSASLVHPREVFGPAIARSAAALVVCHNHPSGDCTPSAEDKDATRRLIRSGELLGIPLLDHLIVAGTGFFSFREHGLLA